MTVSETPDELVALGHEKIAEGHALIAQGLRRKCTTPASAEVVAVRVVAEELGVKPRVLLDAGRRDELRIDRSAAR